MGDNNDNDRRRLRRPPQVLLKLMSSNLVLLVVVAGLGVIISSAGVASVNKRTGEARLPFARTSEERFAFSAFSTFSAYFEDDWRDFTEEADVTYNVSELPYQETWSNHGKTHDCYKIQKGSTTYVICGEGNTAPGRRWDRKCELAIHTMCVQPFIQMWNTRSCHNDGRAGSFGECIGSLWGKKTMNFAVRDAGKSVTMKSVCAKSWMGAERELIQKRFINGGLKWTTKFLVGGFGRVEVLWVAAKCDGP